MDKHTKLTETDESKRVRKSMEKLERLLGDACIILEREVGWMTSEVRDWWAANRDKNARLVTQSEIELREAFAKERFLDSLTPEERRILSAETRPQKG